MVKKILAKSYIYLILLLMYLPILVLIVYSFSVRTSIGDGYEFGFDLWKNLFDPEAKIAGEIWTALANTLIIAIVSALIATILGTLGAIGAFYSGKKTQKAIEYSNNIVSGLDMFELNQIAEYFERYGRRYGLLTEFKENAICWILMMKLSI